VIAAGVSLRATGSAVCSEHATRSVGVRTSVTLFNLNLGSPVVGAAETVTGDLGVVGRGSSCREVRRRAVLGGRAPDRSAGLPARGLSDPEATALVAAEHGLIEQLE
jgi:hypothetical protein